MSISENEYLKAMLDRTSRCYSADEIKAVQNTVVAIAGLGGVGAITVELLARWGVKKFRLLDMDCYEPSNLNRQLFATSHTLGRLKVEVTAERIKEINPFAEIEMVIADRVNNENVQPFVKGAGIIVQNADHPSCKLFYVAARKYEVPLVNGYATITGGRVQTFDYRKSSCEHWLEKWWNSVKYKDVKPLTDMSPVEIEAFDDEYVHSTAASVNFVVNMVGCLIVGETIKLLTGKGENVFYPKYIDFDVEQCKMKIRESTSIFNKGNWQRLLSLFSSLNSKNK